MRFLRSGEINIYEYINKYLPIRVRERIGLGHVEDCRHLSGIFWVKFSLLKMKLVYHIKNIN